MIYRLEASILNSIRRVRALNGSEWLSIGSQLTLNRLRIGSELGLDWHQIDTVWAQHANSVPIDANYITNILYMF